ncbi:MAG: hypothetical protein GEU99_25675, partial [Luteitalea sp.]|nr:hypothetical protein [Luteitalea sp.]
MGGFKRSLGAVFAGFVVGLLIILASEAVGNLFYPWPADLEPGDLDALRAHVASLPLGAFFFVLVAWVVGTVAGTWVGARFARRAPMLH